MQVFRSIFFYVMLFSSTLFLGIMVVITVLLTGMSDLAHLYARLWGNVNLWAAGVRVVVDGLENIDPKTPCIYASNHQSWFDIFAILGKLPVQFRWLAKVELFRIPILGQAMAAIGYIPIDRRDRRKAFQSINQAARQVRSGTSVVIFPEGTRSPDGTLQDFKKGGFVLCIKSQQPVVPISLSGSYTILPKQGKRIIHRGTIRMIIGKPIETSGLAPADREQLIKKVRVAIEKNLKREERSRSGGDS